MNVGERRMDEGSPRLSLSLKTLLWESALGCFPPLSPSICCTCSRTRALEFLLLLLFLSVTAAPALAFLRPWRSGAPLQSLPRFSFIPLLLRLLKSPLIDFSPRLLIFNFIVLSYLGEVFILFFPFFFAMRIRKGNRCLPLAPSDRPFLQQQEASTVTQREKGCGDVKEPDVEANQAMLRLVALAAAPRPVADNVKYLVLEHANGASPVRNKCLENDLEKNRVSADDNFNERSLIHDKGTPPRTKSVFTRHKPAVTTGAICSTSDQPDLLEQSLLPICSRASNAGLNGHNGVASILEQVVPGVIEGDDRLAVQVATSFRNSSKFAELEERGRIVSQLTPAVEENKSLIIGDSEISRGETVSSSDMIEAAIQLQNMQKSYSNSLCSGVVELSETPSIHCGNQEAAQNQTKGFLGRSKVGPNYTDVTTMNHKASSSASKSQNVTQTDQSESQCKRDDGKGWRCSRPAEGGYTMCKYHREQICRAQSRRKRSKFDMEPIVAEKTSPSRYLLNARFEPNAVFTASDCLPFTDDELAYDERRPFVKAKSLKSLLLNTY